MKRLMAAATVLVVAAASPALAEAPAAKKAGKFKVVLRTELRGQDSLSQLLLPSANSGFVFGARARGTWTESLVYRRSAGKWKRAKLPKGVTGEFGHADATSAKNVWATLPRNGKLRARVVGAQGEDEEPKCPDERLFAARKQAARGRILDPALHPAGTSKVLHWNGKRWKVAGAFKNAYVDAITTISAKNVWAYGADKAGAASWHYDGRSWKRQATPFLLDRAGAVSAKEIWGLGLGKDLAAVARYDGGSWKDVTPAKELPNSPAPTLTTKGFQSFVFDVSVVGHRTPWVQAMTFEGPLCGEPDEEGYALPLLRWTGARWDDAATSTTSDWIPFGPTFSDGRGGAAFIGWGADSDEEWDSDLALMHRTKAGRWTVEVLPESLDSAQAFAAQPGTGRLFAAGGLQGKWDVDGALWRR